MLLDIASSILRVNHKQSYLVMELYDGEEDGTVMDKAQGTLVIFPSYVLHEVMPVTKSERNSLVTWVTGKQFR